MQMFRTINIRNCFFTAVFVLTLTACNTNNAVKIETVMLDKQNENANCYTAVFPSGKPINSYMILLPGFGESAESVLKATDFPHKAAGAGIAVFIPLLENGVESYSFSSKSQSALQSIVKDIRDRFDLEEYAYCVGGFSMGGSAAIRYAELASESRPACVFAIDSPLDYERFRYSTERDVKVYRKGISDGDSIYIKLLEDITPIIADSPYLLSDTTHKAILPLKDIPVRYYIEPAEQWWLDNRKTDVLGLNILDATAFINDLRLIGNNNAELIVTYEKGCRNDYKNGRKIYHPHSWTIADADELIKWIIQCTDCSKN